MSAMGDQPQTVRLVGKVGIAGAAEHPHAARRLRQELSGIDWFDIAPAQERGSVPPETPFISLRTESDRPEGGFALTVRGDEGAPTVEVRGGPFSGVIYGVEELLARHTTPRGSGADLAAVDLETAPGLPYRALWTWDHSTNWDLEQIGHQEIGVFCPYGKPPDGFLADYRRLVDFMSRHRIAAVTIYGFLRDSHGGVEAAQELCRYANERGVRILPGVAINAYGGVYWEGDHPFNLATWLRRRPELQARMEQAVGFTIPDLAFPLAFPRSDYTLAGCPSRPENLRWMEEAIAWLAETFAIGGINIESGDYGVCGCELCAARRAVREDGVRRAGNGESWSHADMADLYPRLFEAARSRRDDLWLYCELQWDNLLDAEAQRPLSDLPAGAIYQHTLNRGYWHRVKAELTPASVRALPTPTNVLRAHLGSQWNGDRATERYAFTGRDFAEMAQKSAACGLQGLTVFGEASAYAVPNELNYLAFARFTYDPGLTWERFLAEDVAPRLGGQAAAERFLTILQRLDQRAESDGSPWRALRAEAVANARDAQDGVGRRWLWLAERLAQREFASSA